MKKNVGNAKKSDTRTMNCIKDNMSKERENGKFNIICLKAPKWLSFLIRKFFKNKD